MAGRKVTEELEQWHARIKSAEQITQVKLHEQWQRTLRNYQGEYYTGAIGNDISVPVNVVQALSSIVVPAVYFRDPTIRIKATIPNTDRLVRFHEAHMNYLLKRCKMKRQARLVALDAYLFGIGYWKLGWEAQVERAYEPIIDPETGKPLTDGFDQPLLQDTAGNVFVEEQSGRVKLLIEREGYGAPPGREYPMINEYIEREYPYAIRWSPWDVMKDPLSLMSDCSDAEWVTFRTSMSIDEIRNHPFWENTGKVEPNQEPDYIKNLRDRHMVDALQESKRVYVYETHCKKYDKTTNSIRMYMKVTVDGYGEYLFNEPSPFKVRGFPMETLAFLDNPESPYPLAPIESVRAQIDAINIANTQAANHRERFHHKYLFNKNAGITEKDAKKFARGGIGAVLGIRQDPSIPPNKAFQPADVPMIDQSLLQDIINQWDNVQKVSGVNEHHLGGTGIARQATQASYIESALGVRLNMKQDLMADAMVSICGKFTDLLRQYGDYTQTLKITGVDQQTWDTFKVSESIPQDFDISADMQVAGYQAQEQEKNEMLQFLNIVGNIPGFNLQPIIERLARAFGFPTPELMYQQPPPQVPGQEGPIQSLSQGAIDSSSANRFLNPKAQAGNIK